ncbi:MAG: Fe(3+) ABC transporter substrate-binding protein [Deinococcota bacterium]
MKSILVVATISLIATVSAQEVVNVYTARHYDTDEALYDNFTEQTGIEINWIELGSDEAIERIASEGANSPADVLITVDAGRLWRAKQEGLLQSVDSAVLNERLPEDLRDPDGEWYGLSTRARVIMYNKEMVDPAMLSTYEALANPEFEGMLCIRSSSNIYNISLASSLIENLGVDATEEWAEAVVSNFARPPEGNDTAQIRAAAAGECPIVLANTYYWGRLMASEDPADNAVAEAVGVFFPNQGGRGTHVNISGAGVVATAPNLDNAIQFLEYLTGDEAQTLFAEGNNEYPAVASVAPSGPIASLEEFEAEEINVGVYGANSGEAVQMFDRAGWF